MSVFSSIIRIPFSLAFPRYFVPSSLPLPFLYSSFVAPSCYPIVTVLIITLVPLVTFFVIMAKMVQTHPLDLHEICSIIASSLDLKDLASCARVSQGWNDSFTPTLYNSVNLSEHGPSMESVERNKHHMRHLTIQDSAHEEYFHLQGLDRMMTVRFEGTLNFRGSGGGYWNRLGSYESEMLAAAFLCNNSLALRSIHIARGRFCDEFWERVANSLR